MKLCLEYGSAIPVLTGSDKLVLKNRNRIVSEKRLGDTCAASAHSDLLADSASASLS